MRGERGQEKMSEALSECCEREARRSLKEHRAVAVCDGCHRLLLAWDNPEEQEKTRLELEAHGVLFAEGRVGELYVTAKERTT